MTQTSLFWTTDSFIKKAAANWRLPQGPGRPAMMIVAWGIERPDYYYSRSGLTELLVNQLHLQNLHGKIW